AADQRRRETPVYPSDHSDVATGNLDHGRWTRHKTFQRFQWSHQGQAGEGGRSVDSVCLRPRPHAFRPRSVVPEFAGPGIGERKILPRYSQLTLAPALWMTMK